MSFLTVKEAASRTGKSPSSIRRVLYPIIHDDAHPDRAFVEPSIDDALKLRMRGENFAWRLSEELLQRLLPPATHERAAPLSGKSVDHGEGELLAMLRRELDIKNQQITTQAELLTRQMELVNGLSERLREGNILIGSLQQRLALPEASAPTTDTHPQPRKAAAVPAEKGSKPPAKADKRKRTFLARLFG